MSKPTLLNAQLEQLALALYQDNLRVQPELIMPDPNDETKTLTVPMPRWAEAGTKVRNAYRQAVIDLLGEY